MGKGFSSNFVSLSAMTVASSLQLVQGFKGNVELSMTFIGLRGIVANLADIMFPPKCLAQDQQRPLHSSCSPIRMNKLAFKQDKIIECKSCFSSVVELKFIGRFPHIVNVRFTVYPGRSACAAVSSSPTLLFSCRAFRLILSMHSITCSVF